MNEKHDQHTNLARLISAGALVLLALIAFAMIRMLPPQHSPFARIDLEQPLGLATPVQMAAVRDNSTACLTALAESGIEVARVEDNFEGQCGFSSAVSLTRTHFPYSQPVSVSCPVAAALYLWEREVVAPAATWLESPVARIETMGAYSCRPIAGRTDGRMSEHSTGNAIDIAGFRLENGRFVSVEDGWNGSAADAAFLRQVRDGGCRVFRTVLSPDYNRAHRDHLHLDMGAFSMCR